MPANKPCRYPQCPRTKAERGYCDVHASRRPAFGKWSCGDRTVTQRTKHYGSMWRRLRLLYIRRHPLCVHCGKAGDSVDHIVPLRDGGSDNDANLQTLCRSCHSIKTLKERNDRAIQSPIMVNCQIGIRS